VLIILAAQTPLSSTYRDQLIERVRRELDDPEAVVVIHYLREAWVEPQLSPSNGARPQAP